VPSILFGGRRYVESEFAEAVDDVVQQAARDERRFWQVMTSGRSIVRYVWDRMQQEPALKVAWAARWLAAAEEFALVQETWGARPDRFWRGTSRWERRGPAPLPHHLRPCHPCRSRGDPVDALRDRRTRTSSQ
jgi:hypothetical protein